MDLEKVLKYFKRDEFHGGADAVPGQKNDVRIHVRLGVIQSQKNSFVDPTPDDLQRFIEVSEEEYPLGLDELEFKEGQLNFVVSRKVDGKWTFNTPEPHQHLLGEMYDIKDSRGRFYEGYINEISETQGYKVHYINWASKWDEWIPKDEREDRFLVRSTKTTGPYIPKAKRQAQSGASASSGSGGYSSYYSNYNQHEKGQSVAKGVVGLRNLGNTCFMNSTLQCLMQAPGLTDFFNDPKWKQQINRDNPLGKNGRVADQYGNLIAQVFSGQYRVVTPRDFKKVIGEFAPRFVGYQQQDSQELLAFLLDGLHEDLNRIHKKPYTESVESEGRKDPVVAKESWETYKKRNDSIIVDLLQGQYKSKLICPDCKRTSITFDPFMYLSVPLPTEKYKIQPITYVPINGDPPKKYGIKVLKQRNVGYLKQVIAKKFDVNPNFIVAADIWKHKVHRQCRNNDPVVDLRDSDDIWVYHIPPIPAVKEGQKSKTPDAAPMAIDGEGDDAEQPQGPTLLRCEILHVTKQNTLYNYVTTPLGIPLFVTLNVTQDLTYEDVYKTVLDVLNPCLHSGNAKEESGSQMEQDDEEELGLDEDDDECPFEIKFAVEDNWGYFGRDEKTLAPSDKAFDEVKNVRFTVVWKNTRRYNAKRYVQIEKDESFPVQDQYGSKNEAVGLESCLNAFTEEETLSEENAWYCSNCKKHQCATKKIDLWRLPDILVIHLKRFSYSHHYRNKITTMVNFPLEKLDLKDWISENCDLDQSTTYNLFGSSMHSGGLGGGHYTAYAQSHDNKKWYYLNDSSVSNAQANSCQSPSAYLLFYQRVK